MEIAGLYVAAFLLGSVPTAFILGKLVRGIDIRKYGSGNVGGGNVNPAPWAKSGSCRR